MADYIDREAFRAVLQKSHRYHAGNCREVSLLSRDIRLLNEQPAADVAPVVHGRWNEGVCMTCNFDLRALTDGENDLEQWVWDCGLDYCPNCGAKMGGEPNV